MDMGSAANAGDAVAAADAAARARMRGLGNKAIALKLCRRVALRDFSLLMGGHFAMLATGTDDLTIENVTVDTNRDGFDIDACRNVRIANCVVNAPNDDAIVLKSSHALGVARPVENVTVTNCRVSGYDAGTLLAGTRKRTQERAPDRDGVTGRIKLGTESNGGYRNIAISDCTFDRSRGLALETVDGGVLEDVTVSNLALRDITTAPIFLRIGNRARGPEGTGVGAIRRVKISDIVAEDCESRFASSIAGLPGHAIEDVELRNIRIVHRGGGTSEDARREPPENETGYPEPSMFGTLPASALFVRHGKNIRVRDLHVSFLAPDARPPFVLHDVSGARFESVHVPRARDAAGFVLRDVKDFEARNVDGVADARLATAKNEELR
jgi:polygalacturonase